MMLYFFVHVASSSILVLSREFSGQVGFDLVATRAESLKRKNRKHICL